MWSLHVTAKCTELHLRWRFLSRHDNHTETEMSKFWRNAHYRLHGKLSKWQLSVLPLMKMSPKWRHIRFNAGQSLLPRQDDARRNYRLHRIHSIYFCLGTRCLSLRWRHNGRLIMGVSNHQPHHCVLNRLFGCRSKKTSKLCVTGLCAGNSPGTGEFPAQMASNAENVSIWWRHHVCGRSNIGLEQELNQYPHSSSPAHFFVIHYVETFSLFIMHRLT